MSGDSYTSSRPDRWVIATWRGAQAPLAAGAGAAAVGGQTRDVVISAASGAAPVIWERLRAHISQGRNDKVEEVILCSSSIADMTVAEFEAAVVGSDSLLYLAETVLEASVRKSAQGHRRALARCLANGLRDEAAIDEEWAVGRALAAVDEPHVQVLARLSLPQPASPASFVRQPIYSLDLIREAMPSVARMLDPIMSVLEAEGLVFAKGSAHFADRDWTITDFGRLCLDRLRDEGLDVQAPADDKSPRWRRWKEEQGRIRELDRRIKSGDMPSLEDLIQRPDDGTATEPVIYELSYGVPADATDHMSPMFWAFHEDTGCVGQRTMGELDRDLRWHGHHRLMQGAELRYRWRDYDDFAAGLDRVRAGGTFEDCAKRETDGASSHETG